MSSRATLILSICCLLGLVIPSNAQAKSQKSRSENQISDRVVKKIEATGVDSLPIHEKDLGPDIRLEGSLADVLKDFLTNGCLKKDQPLIIHFATWGAGSSDGPYELKSSNWYIYHGKLTNDICKLKQAALKADDQPLLYGDSQDAVFLGLSLFDPLEVKVKIIYKVSTTPKKPDNVQNLGMLLSAIAGISLKGGLVAQPQPPSKFYQAKGTIPAYKTLPFEFNIGFTLTPAAKSGTNADTSPDTPSKDTVPLQDGQVNEAYERRLAESGQTYKIATGGGKVPAGLSLSPDGTITGTPQKAGEYKFSVEISDNSQPPKTKTIEYTMRIFPAPEAPGGAPPAPKPSNDTSTSKAKTGKSPASQSSDGSTSQDASKDTAAIDCTAASKDSPCILSRSFRSDDKEWWDVGLAISIPGVKEAQFSLDKNNVIQRTVTTHTNLYAMADFYPFFYWKSKDDAWPHLNAGLPVTSKTFYRPYFGGAQNLTRLTHIDRHGFPVRMDFFAGIVYAKEFRLTQFKVGDTVTPSAFSAALKPTRVIKPIFGIEVPVAALISKIGKSK